MFFAKQAFVAFSPRAIGSGLLWIAMTVNMVFLERLKMFGDDVSREKFCGVEAGDVTGNTYETVE